MRIIAVDDERLALQEIITQLKEIDPKIVTEGFLNPQKALQAIETGQPVDVAFLDVEMYEMSGLELARRIKIKSPQTAIVFLTGYSNYAIDAFKVRARGYLLKPASLGEIKEELDSLRTIRKPPSKHKIRVQTFGNFEVFAENVPVKFGRSKSKELFAYLVDRRGASMSMQDIIAALWEEDTGDIKLQSLLRNVVADMKISLQKAGGGDIILKSRNQIAVNVTCFDCDYYDYLQGDAYAVNLFAGEYMTNYSWAEFTTGMLVGE